MRAVENAAKSIDQLAQQATKGIAQGLSGAAAGTGAGSGAVAGGGGAAGAPDLSNSIAAAVGTLVDKSKQIDPNAVIRGGVNVAGQAAQLGSQIGQKVFLGVDEEWANGDQIYAAIISELRLSSDQFAVNHLRELARPLLNGLVRTRGRVYTVDLVEDPAVNAFSTIGGHVFVYRGLVNEMRSDVAIQSAIAHEIGHVELAHCAVATWPKVVAGGYAGNIGAAVAEKAFDVLVVRAFSEDQEFEADEFAYRAQGQMGVSKVDRLVFGERLMAYSVRTGQAGMDLDQNDPTVTGTIAQELRKHWRTHPSPASRVQRLRSLP